MGKLVVLMFTAFVDMVGSTMIFPLVPFYATRMGANGSMVGVILASYAVAQLASAPGWGRFSDRYGRRPAILVGLLISSVAYVVFAFTDSLPLLLLSRLVQGVGGGTVGVLQAYVADSIGEDERAKSLGWLSAATSFGVIVGPAFGSFLTVAWGRRAPGIGAAILCLAISAFASRYLRESSGKITVERTARSRPHAGRGALMHVLTHPNEPAPRLILIYAIAMGGFYGTGQFMPLVLAERFGVTEKNVGYFFMYFGLMGVILRAILLGPIVRRLGEPRVARMGVVFLAAGLCLLAVSASWATLFISFTLLPLGTAFLFPCVTALLSVVVPARERGLLMGVQQSYGGIARVAFPLGAGLIVDRFGTGVPFMLAGLLVLGTLALSRSLARRPVLSVGD
jgi:multidrug resistance protein